MEECDQAVAFEIQRVAPSGLTPSADRPTREKAAAIAARNSEARRLHRLWQRLAKLFADDDAETAPDIVVRPPDEETGARRILFGQRRRLNRALSGLPILHLDATLRPDLATALLPGMRFETVEAEAPHMKVTLVEGRFSKSALDANTARTPDQKQACQRRLADVVTQVEWRARIMTPGRTLVITHKAIEESFAGLPDVDTAHFNAIAGLDIYKDVAQLIVVGRPLPGSEDLGIMAGTLFGEDTAGEYGFDMIGLPLRTGRTFPVKAIRHSDPAGELLRAAICDDELLQAIGRGRGINRTADTPLHIILMADVALPLVIDDVQSWELLRPDVLQKMLLAGVATDSPADAAALHPALFSNAEQAKKALAGVFKGKSLISIYREISLKSASYRRGGQGRRWQRCWWIDGDAFAARAQMEAVLGPLAGWEAG
jgi:hypothetical protein